MIQMKYKDLLHPQLSPVLGKIANTPMNPARSYELNKLLSAIRTARKSCQEESTEILKNFVEFENGKPKFRADPPPEKPDSNYDGTPKCVFLKDYSLEHPEYLKAFDEFEEKIASLNFRPWSLEMLSGILLSAAELDLLGVLITDKPFLQAVTETYDGSAKTN